ncbi:hypothetical protein LTR95_002705 [Oleoguttula sp. CCFEE 5521]
MSSPRRATTATTNPSLTSFLANPANHPLPPNAKKAYALIPVLPPTPLEVFEDRQDRRRTVNHMRINVWSNPHNRTKVDDLPEVEMQLIDLRLPTFRYVGRPIGQRAKERYFQQKREAEIVEIEFDDWKARLRQRKQAEAQAAAKVERRVIEAARFAGSACEVATTEVSLPMCKRTRSHERGSRVKSLMRHWEARLKATAEAAAGAEAAEMEDEVWSRGVHQETSDGEIEALVMMDVEMEDDDWARGVHQETTDALASQGADFGAEDAVTVAGEQGTPDNELDERHLAVLAQEALGMAEPDMCSTSCQEGW